MAVGALALGACGGAQERDEKNAYVRRGQRRAERVRGDRHDGLGADHRQELVQRGPQDAAQFQTAIDDVVSQLRGINVPGNVKTEHSQLVTAMSGFGAQIKKATDALRNPDARAIAERAAGRSRPRRRGQRAHRIGDRRDQLQAQREVGVAG